MPVWHLEEAFPVWGLLPKKETGVSSFLTKYPEYDGRGVVIAILDSGVDPGAPGLQETSDGKVKVIHRFDCSGCGDVQTTTTAVATDGYITGLTGRKLKIPDTWINPTGTYKIGVKAAYDLYPDRLIERIKNEYKEKKWDEHHRLAVAEVTRMSVEFESKHQGATLNDADKLKKEDIDAKLEFLNSQDKKFSNNGPVYDCVLFHDGVKWQCCVDTTEAGDLAQCPILGEYSITHEYAPLTPTDQLNFSINVHDSGNMLELVGLCSSHGTHVASIASAYFPESPEENGVAPGAQIVSLTIGDGRLGSMETGTALVRAVIKIIELNKEQPIHVINMSYGEHAHWSESGRVGDIINEVVNKYGIVWVASAGNHGPALSTIGTPPDISQETVIGVGAYVSPDMMIAEYAMRQKLPGSPYTWSSRGPTMDGGLGVSICAPGGAITSVPNFTLRKCQLMNGTSMAAPHISGSVGIIISGLLQKSIPYSPYSIKRSLENCAEYLKDIEVFAQGNGLAQIDKSFDHLVEYGNSIENNVRFHVMCGQSNGKGIYMRSGNGSDSQLFNVTIEPCFLDSDNVPPKEKINFNMRLVLECKAPFVSYPTHLDLSNTSRVFAVKVDISSLAVGVHHTFINAFEVNNIKKGAIFKIPVTVVQAYKFTNSKHVCNYSDVVFKPNTIKRHFISVPSNATWGVIKISLNEGSTNGRFVIHTMQILPKLNCKSVETNKVLNTVPNAESCTSFQVKGGVVLEVCLAKSWSSLGETDINYSIGFFGVKPNQPLLNIHMAEGIHTIDIVTLQGEDISPVVTLKSSAQILRPNEAKISPLTARDVIPSNRQIYELVLVYNFNLSKATEVSPDLALLSNVLYESEFESQMWMLYDVNKQLMGVGDAYSSKYSVKLERGDYTVRAQVRHEKKEYLEKICDASLIINQKLANPINLDVYSSFNQALIGGKKAGNISSINSVFVPVYIAPLPSDKFQPKINNPAQYLFGYVTYCRDELGKKVDVYPLKYMLHEGSAKKNNNNVNNNLNKDNDKDKSKIDEYKEALRDFKVSWLPKIDSANLDKFYEEFTTDYPDHLPFHSLYLQCLDPLDIKTHLPVFMYSEPQNINTSTLLNVISICDKIIEAIDEDALLSYLAFKADLRPDSQKIKVQMEQQKNILVDAFCRKGIALCRLYEHNDEESKTSKLSIKQLNEIRRNLAKYCDLNDIKISSTNVLIFSLWYSLISKHIGKLLKYLSKYQEEKSTKEVEEKIIEICRILNWNHIADHLDRNLPTKFPSAYRIF